MRRSRRHGRQAMTTLAELNVTPMLDLAFVLLIIFMITAPLLASRVDLIIPTTRAQRDAVSPDDTLIVEMNREGVLEIDGQVVSLEGLQANMEAERSRRAQLGVLIRADASLSLGTVMPVLDRLKAAGVVDVGFMARSDP